MIILKKKDMNKEYGYDDDVAAAAAADDDDYHDDDHDDNDDDEGQVELCHRHVCCTSSQVRSEYGPSEFAA